MDHRLGIYTVALLVGIHIRLHTDGLYSPDCKGQGGYGAFATNVVLTGAAVFYLHHLYSRADIQLQRQDRQVLVVPDPTSGYLPAACGRLPGGCDVGVLSYNKGDSR